MDELLKKLNQLKAKQVKNCDRQNDQDLKYLKSCIDNSNISTNLERLLALVNTHIPSFRMRQRPLRFPYNKANIKVDQSFANVSISSG